jgi:hypothetical protein
MYVQRKHIAQAARVEGSLPRSLVRRNSDCHCRRSEAFYPLTGGPLGTLKLKIFLSHASQDRATAEPITFSLRSRGYKVFLDRDDLPAGASYDQQIERAVIDSEILIFLISPDSVAEGRYTLTELLFARRKWPDPKGRVLPVMARKTSLDLVPPYLKAVTILEPVGNIAAETSAAVSKMRPEPTRIGIWAAGAAAVLIGIASVVAWSYGLIPALHEIEQPPLELTDSERLSQFEKALPLVKVKEIQTAICMASPTDDLGSLDSAARNAMSEFFEGVGLGPSRIIDSADKLNLLNQAITRVKVRGGGTCESAHFSSARDVGGAIRTDLSR